MVLQAMPTPPLLDVFITRDELIATIERAKREDMGEINRDITSQVFIPGDRPCVATMHARKSGVLAGAALFPLIAQAYDPAIKLDSNKHDGDALAPRDAIATFKGPLRSVLAMERIALNFATHLAGIATLTAAFVNAVKGTKAKICDTRKTIPGLRGLEKYAVACGGGCNHRIGLYDAVLVKDNHLAHVPAGDLQKTLDEAIQRARAAQPPPAFIEVEVDTLEQLERVLSCDVDIVLLDNMTTSQLQQAVTMRDRAAPKVELEASGGVNLDTVRSIAATGVDRISVGALTHSAPALDLGLDID